LSAVERHVGNLPMLIVLRARHSEYACDIRCDRWIGEQTMLLGQRLQANRVALPLWLRKGSDKWPVNMKAVSRAYDQRLRQTGSLDELGKSCPRFVDSGVALPLLGLVRPAVEI
jgi:hypothetical protein